MSIDLNESLFLEAEEDDDEGLIARNKDGKFYKQTEDGSWQPVKAWEQKDYEVKYYLEQTRRKKAEAENIDIEAEKIKDVERCKDDGSLGKLGQRIIDKGEEFREYQREEEDEAEAAARKRIAAQKLRQGSNSSELQQALGLEIKDFMANLLEKTPKYHKEVNMFKQDPFQTLDPRVPAFAKVKNRKNPDMQTKWDKLPMVLFYFDRSGSFSPSSHPDKTRLGKNLIKMFKEWEIDPATGQKRLEFPEIMYFGTKVYPGDESKALRDGNNNGENLLLDIQARTKGKIANIVILTDSDENASLPIDVCGSVWCVFAGTTCPDLYNSFNMVDMPDGQPSKKAYYHFKNIR